ncbi:MAG: methionyl-tRNA formyltransferase [Candidatus Moranbacteria bacterium]|nr:methionyl-tRNA formyltransferase [Candidatus Moranbacteria bacterium]
MMMSKPRILIATIKSWNIHAAKCFARGNPKFNVKIFSTKQELSMRALRQFDPAFIFFPHWSWIIPKQIHENFVCVGFHITDLPYGRGGSPLQNLIVRGCAMTKISAFRISEEMDGGPVYLKKNLTLEGTAESILTRTAEIVFKKMIPEIINKKMIPEIQKGRLVKFQRRTYQDGNLVNAKTMKQIFDYIRMLDGEGYPPAFLEFGDFIVEFSGAHWHGRNLKANVNIRKK